MFGLSIWGIDSFFLVKTEIYLYQNYRKIIKSIDFTINELDEVSWKIIILILLFT